MKTSASGRVGFSETLKLSSFDSTKTLGGSSYVYSKGNYQLEIEVSHGEEAEWGAKGSSIQVYLREGTNSAELLNNGFVEGVSAVTESMGRKYYDNARVERYIEGSMPYYIDLANKRIKNK